MAAFIIGMLIGTFIIDRNSSFFQFIKVQRASIIVGITTGIVSGIISGFFVTYYYNYIDRNY